MPNVLMIRDKPETIFTARDFEYHIEQCMGYEAAAYFMELFEDAEAEVESAKRGENTDLASYEASLESNTRAFQDILETLTSMEEMLYKQRVNKPKIAELISVIRKTINNQI